MNWIFDTHAHYDDEAFDRDRDSLLSSLPQNGIKRVVNVGSGPVSCERTLELSRRFDFIYAAVGFHPSETGKLTGKDLLRLEESCAYEKCVAVGEIGLDYHWDEPAKNIQKEWFVRQLDLARRVKKPVIIHSREAAKDTADILSEEHAADIGGVIHCYSYTKEMAKIYLDMNFYFGIGGVITFKNAKKLREAAEYIPLDRIVLETDSPYLSPEPDRGKRNSSLNLPLVVEALAGIKGLSRDEIRRATWENALRLYNLTDCN